MVMPSEEVPSNCVGVEPGANEPVRSCHRPIWKARESPSCPSSYHPTPVMVSGCSKLNVHPTIPLPCISFHVWLASTSTIGPEAPQARSDEYTIVQMVNATSPRRLPVIKPRLAREPSTTILFGNSFILFPFCLIESLSTALMTLAKRLATASTRIFCN
jgi:hypothetical protein